jgi:hypothetical protein
VGRVTDPASLPVFPPPEVQFVLRARMLTALTDMALAPDVDADGDVVVMVDQQRLFVRCTDSTPPLARVFGQWQIDSEVPGDELLRLQAANAVTMAIHLVKTTLVEDRLVSAVDLIVTDDLHLPSLLSAAMGMVVQSVQTWHATVSELSSDPAAVVTR